MEKRVFFLTPKRGTAFLIALCVICAAIVGLQVWLWLGRRSHWWVLWNAWFLLAAGWALAFPQGGTLEISDEGLFLTIRRGVGYLLRWDAIQSVRVHEHSDAARRWSAIIEDSQGHVVRVPRTCKQKSGILDILRQRLPESVFQSW